MRCCTIRAIAPFGPRNGSFAVTGGANSRAAASDRHGRHSARRSWSSRTTARPARSWPTTSPADGYELIEADCAADAQRLIETTFPDLAIVDLGLPDRDGLELLRRVRDGRSASPAGIDPDLPLLVLTGRVGELDRLRGFDRGADDYMVKPFCYHELRARVGALLRRNRRRPRIRAPARSGRSSSTRWRARCGSTAQPRVACPRRSSRCCARSRASRPACSRARSCCAASGASGRSGTTRTLDSHACRLRQKLERGRATVRRQRVGRRLPAASTGASSGSRVARAVAAGRRRRVALAVALGRGARARRGWRPSPARATSCAGRSPRRGSGSSSARGTARALAGAAAGDRPRARPGGARARRPRRGVARRAARAAARRRRRFELGALLADAGRGVARGARGRAGVELAADVRRGRTVGRAGRSCCGSRRRPAT